jgi:membrane protein YdbS with pleckstrin-like domain
MSIQVVDIERPVSRAFRIARETKTTAGIKTELIGLTLHAASAELAIQRAKKLFPWATGVLVALPQES